MVAVNSGQNPRAEREGIKNVLKGKQCYQKCPNFGFSPNSDLSTEIA